MIVPPVPTAQMSSGAVPAIPYRFAPVGLEDVMSVQLVPVAECQIVPPSPTAQRSVADAPQTARIEARAFGVVVAAHEAPLYRVMVPLRPLAKTLFAAVPHTLQRKPVPPPVTPTESHRFTAVAADATPVRNP
jgi:hypothetical protein